MAKVYIFFADGYEEIEGLTVVDLLRRANIDIRMVSVTGELFVTGSHQITSKVDLLFEQSDFSDGDMLVLPGGMPGTRNLKEHAGLDLLIKKFHAEGKWISAICAAPSVLGAKGLLKDRSAICYPGYEKELIGAKIINEPVVIDGNVITSKGMGTAIDFSLAIIERLAGAAQAIKIASAIQYEH